MTRSGAGADAIEEALVRLGARPLRVPLVRFHPTGLCPPAPRPGDAVLLLSPRAAARCPAAAWPPGVEVLAVGTATAGALRRAGWGGPLRVGGGTALELLRDPAVGAALRGRRLVWPRGDHATPGVAEALAALGAEVEPVVVYRNELPPGAGEALVRAWPWDVATLASGSAARRYARLRPRVAAARRVAAIGPSTAEAARRAGLEVVGVAARPTVEALAEVAVRALAAPGGADHGPGPRRDA